MPRSPEMSPEQARAIKQIEALKQQLKRTTDAGEQQQIVAQIEAIAEKSGLR